MTANSTPGLSCVAATGDRCGEGAVWHARERALYWVDINRFLIHRMAAQDQSVRTWHFAEPPTALALTERDDTLLAVFGSRICLWRPAENRIVKEIFRLPGWPEVRFNDARVDPRGSLWAGTMANNVGRDGERLPITRHEGVLYRIDPDGSHSIWKEKIGISNTVVWSPDKTVFYFADSLANAIYRYRYNLATGDIDGEEPFLTGHRGIPDGSAMDVEGNLWNCRPNAGCLLRISPDGQRVTEYPLPVSFPTTCVFGGDNLSTLYITSGASPERLAGCLFALQTETSGLADYRYRLL